MGLKTRPTKRKLEKLHIFFLQDFLQYTAHLIVLCNSQGMSDLVLSRGWDKIQINCNYNF